MFRDISTVDFVLSGILLGTFISSCCIQLVAKIGQRNKAFKK